MKRLMVVGFFVLLTVCVSAQQFSGWSAPVNLGPTVNSAGTDGCPALSRDGLSLYFASTRAGGQGGIDLWVTQRASLDDPWQPPAPMGTAINTASDELCPALSTDGHLLFFASNRPGGCGGRDLYVARRENARDDFGWGEPQNLGCIVNSPLDDFGEVYYEDEAHGAMLYFNSNRAGGAGGQDLYVTTRAEDGSFGVPVPVAELNTPANDQQPAISRDGLEFIFTSDRPGGSGAPDLWVATRASTSDTWGTPVDLGPIINSSAPDKRPALSWNGTELYFGSNRAHPNGATDEDLYVARRSKITGQLQ
jgi:hypothetical protein